MKIQPDARLPSKKRKSDAAYDLYSVENVVLEPMAATSIGTGIAVEFPPGYVALIWDRSGLGAKGIHRLAGVIDCEYRGEWRVVLINLTGWAFPINKGDRIAQVLFQRVEEALFEETDQLSDSDRGDAGFGSSGR